MLQSMSKHIVIVNYELINSDVSVYDYMVVYNVWMCKTIRYKAPTPRGGHGVVVLNKNNVFLNNQLI